MKQNNGQEDRLIGQEEVDRIAVLARLSPEGSERESLAGEMSQIIGFFNQLNELDTSSIEPLHHVLDLQNILRDDVVVPSLPVGEALKNGPVVKGDYFVVPQVIKGSVE